MENSLFELVIGVGLVVVGVGGYLGKGRPIHRLPVLDDKQQSLLLAAFGLLLIVLGLVHVL